MSIKINYSNKSPGDLSSNTVLFSDEKFNTSNLRKYLSGSELSYINEILKIIDIKKIYMFLRLVLKKR